VPSSVPIATANGFVTSDNVKLNVATSPEQAEAGPQATELFVIRASDELNVELTTVVNPDPGTAAAENAEITSAEHVAAPRHAQANVAVHRLFKPLISLSPSAGMSRALFGV
jgi:hypothetical protein